MNFVGECDCFEGYLLWPETVTGGNKICYQEFTRGPCEDGKQVGIKDGLTVCQVRQRILKCRSHFTFYLSFIIELQIKSRKIILLANIQSES